MVDNVQTVHQKDCKKRHCRNPGICVYKLFRESIVLSCREMLQVQDTTISFSDRDQTVDSGLETFRNKQSTPLHSRNTNVQVRTPLNGITTVS